MGTRSLTTFIDDFTKEEIVVLYRQYDGYPEGHGKDLLNYLNNMKLVNGIPGGKKASQLANGMSCLAAQVVSHFKKGVGDFYLHAADTRDHGEEFVYTVYEENNELKVKVEDTYSNKILFDGNTEKMGKWIGNGASKVNITESIVTGKWVSDVRQQEDGFTD